MGLGESVQKLFYLPEAQTDFLFAVLAEELGLMGVVATLVLFLLLVWRVLHIARLAANAGLAFQAAIAASFGLWVGIQSLINIGVNIGRAAHQGFDAAADELWTQQHAGHTRLARARAARVPRGADAHARFGQRRTRRAQTR